MSARCLPEAECRERSKLARRFRTRQRCRASVDPIRCLRWCSRVRVFSRSALWITSARRVCRRSSPRPTRRWGWDHSLRRVASTSLCHVRPCRPDPRSCRVARWEVEVSFHQDVLEGINAYTAMANAGRSSPYEDYIQWELAKKKEEARKAKEKAGGMQGAATAQNPPGAGGPPQ